MNWITDVEIHNPPSKSVRNTDTDLFIDTFKDRRQSFFARNTARIRLLPLARLCLWTCLVTVFQGCRAQFLSILVKGHHLPRAYRLVLDRKHSANEQHVAHATLKSQQRDGQKNVSAKYHPTWAKFNGGASAQTWILPVKNPVCRKPSPDTRNILNLKRKTQFYFFSIFNSSATGISEDELKRLKLIINTTLRIVVNKRSPQAKKEYVTLEEATKSASNSSAESNQFLMEFNHRISIPNEVLRIATRSLPKKQQMKSNSGGKSSSKNNQNSPAKNSQAGSSVVKGTPNSRPKRNSPRNTKGTVIYRLLSDDNFSNSFYTEVQ